MIHYTVHFNIADEPKPQELCSKFYDWAYLNNIIIKITMLSSHEMIYFFLKEAITTV